MSEDNTVKATSIFPDNEVEFVRENYPTMPTWLLLVILVICMVILKSFIYTKDAKRHNK